MDELLHRLQSLYPLSTELQVALVTRTTKETHRKRKTLLSNGQVCDSLYFIERGLVKVCYDIPAGDERIISFARGGQMVCAVKSFTTGVASRVSLVALDETVVRRIRKVEIEAVCEKYPPFNIHMRKIIEAQTFLLEDHYLLFALQARARYLGLVKEGSWILRDKRIKDYMIADYLGIDRATFSRFRNGK